ncbi:(S)-benzoin forming benzil reductase [Tenacibaculum sp. IB213877]|uniref:(S)-benzoin forming benzil reductase n=1 Tax=Tenacibaculum sp. IB213877 TaxID=3097351 RepID=UPI002A5A0D82|nr:(S)-benzoin forming benzil reductase [Tenacibaculum sp. IB213877]MDY0779635.1 (S)-benzoin forming benzil reductase [Tenacibaculum sp. IB213877]
MNIAIITGGSKGIGKALALHYASNNYKVYSLARSIADIQEVTQISVDLSNLKETHNSFKMLMDEIKKQEIHSITLINNAGRLGTISNLENISSEDISQSIQLNTTTPLVLSSLFIKQTQQLTCKKHIINISSGAAVNAYAGWSVYCTSKAALDMLTKSISEEQKDVENGVKCFGIRPGVVDTNMQSQIRSTDPQDFKNLQRFIDLKENKQLFSAEFVAKTIYTLEQQNKLINGETIDVRDFV